MNTKLEPHVGDLCLYDKRHLALIIKTNKEHDGSMYLTLCLSNGLKVCDYYNPSYDVILQHATK